MSPLQTDISYKSRSGKYSQPASCIEQLYVLSGFSVGAEYIHDLVSVHLLHLLTCGLEILTGIEVAGILCEMPADSAGHCKT